MLKNVLLSDADEVLIKYREENNIESEMELIEENEECQIWESKSYIHIHELNIKWHDKATCESQRDTETGRVLRDKKTGKIIYGEPDYSWVFRDFASNQIIWEDPNFSIVAAIVNGFKRDYKGLKCDIHI